jgi:hypothetical protein
MSRGEAHHGMTDQTTPLYVVCSPCRRVGKTLVSRLLTEFYVVNDRPVAAFDLADEGPQLADYLPGITTIADINVSSECRASSCGLRPAALKCLVREAAKVGVAAALPGGSREGRINTWGERILVDIRGIDGKADLGKRPTFKLAPDPLVVLALCRRLLPCLPFSDD